MLREKGRIYPMSESIEHLLMSVNYWSTTAWFFALSIEVSISLFNFSLGTLWLLLCCCVPEIERPSFYLPAADISYNLFYEFTVEVSIPFYWGWYSFGVSLKELYNGFLYGVYNCKTLFFELSVFSWPSISKDFLVFLP